MDRKRKQIKPSDYRKIFVLFLSLLCFVSGFSTRYTANIPRVEKVEKVELFSLKKQGDICTGEMLGQKVVVGEEAEKIASLWQDQSFFPNSAICHNPGYAIKFYAQGELKIYATLCWECDNIEFITPKLEKLVAFDARGDNGQQLLRLFEGSFPERN